MRSETTQRVMTAAVLVVVAVSVIVYWPPALIGTMFVALVGVCAWEWTHLAMLRALPARWAYTIVTAMFATGVIHGSAGTGFALAFMIIGCLWWFVAAVLLGRYQAGVWEVPWRYPMLLFLGWLLVLPATSALVALYVDDRRVLLLFMVTIWLADSAAYFGGRRWGRRKLANRVSPGKTWEGLFVALAAVTAMSSAYAWIRGSGGSEILMIGLLCAASAGTSVIGDLFVSLIKRHANLKDSGTLLPGHGGVWDRIDGVTAAAPVFALVWLAAEGFR